MKMMALVRGKEVLNDATIEDANYAGLGDVADIISNGTAVAGTIYDMMPEEARNAFDEADVILAKGQGNYESMSGCGRHVSSFWNHFLLLKQRSIYSVKGFTGQDMILLSAI